MTEKHDMRIFTDGQSKQDFRKAGGPLRRHIYDYVITDSETERIFARELDSSGGSCCLRPSCQRGFSFPRRLGIIIPTGLFLSGKVPPGHVYFAWRKTKGSMSSMELREIEKTKIECARKFFDEINSRINPDNVRYDVVNSFDKLMEIVGAGTVSSGGGAA